MPDKPRLKFLFELFTAFFLISPVTFGGGFAMIPVLEREVVEKRKWVKSDEMVDMLVVAQSVPGAVAVNSAICVGYRLAGIRGALAAGTGIVLPTFIIIIVLAAMFSSFGSNRYIQAALTGIKPVVAALIAFAGYRTCRGSIRDLTGWILLALSVAALFLFNHLNLFLLILAGAFAGIGINKVKSVTVRGRETDKPGDGDKKAEDP